MNPTGSNSFQFQLLSGYGCTVHCPLTEIANIELFFIQHFALAFFAIFELIVIWFWFGVEKVFDFTFSENGEKLMAKWFRVNHKQHTNLPPPPPPHNVLQPFIAFRIPNTLFTKCLVLFQLVYIAFTIFSFCSTQNKIHFSSFRS